LNNIYSASVNFDRLGGFCAPTDSVAQEKLMETANLNQKWNFLDVFDSIKLSVLISLAIGIVWSQLVQCLPRLMTSFVTVLSILTLAGIGVVMLIDHSEGVSSIWKLIIAIVSITIAVMFAFFLCFFRRRNRLTGVFIDWSTKLTK
jgi:predicted Na+-dependent transporter